MAASSVGMPSDDDRDQIDMHPSVDKRSERLETQDDRDPVIIERLNLMSILKLVVKELIESSMKYGRMLDSDNVPLQHFFIVLEHVMRHGLKPKKGLLGPRKELWNVLETVERCAPEAQDITTSVRDLPTVKTQMGRARAWLRLALMQKRLADYFKCLVDRKEDTLSEFYEPTALMVCDEAVIIAGLLVGLNVIDCNFCVKEEDLDSQQGVIDFSLYLRDNSNVTSPQQGLEPSNMSTVLDQKNYIEELNRHLNATVTNLQAKVENLQTTNALMKEDLAIAKNQILALQDVNEGMKNQRDHSVEEHRRKLEDARADMSAERETYLTSRAGLDNMYHDASKKLQDESRMRSEAERELELQISMKQEMEMAMKLLEKDIHEKQDTIVSLRRQLEDVKLINLEMYKKLQACESSLKHKTELVGKLEQKNTQMAEVVKELEEKLGTGELDRALAEETARKLGLQLSERESERYVLGAKTRSEKALSRSKFYAHPSAALHTDLMVEREWRTSLQETLVQDRERISQMNMEMSQLKAQLKDYEDLKVSHRELRRTCEEHEQTLKDLAAHLGESKMKMEDFKEASKAMKEAVWTSDKEATRCKRCDKEFSLSRRKHHCRHCGYIFCNACSDNAMLLPSSSKAARVCDDCHTLLLQRCSAT